MTIRLLAPLALGLVVSGCSATTEAPPGYHSVDISWAANHERGVNVPGGGYRLSIDGRPEVDLPYVSGDLAPTSLTTTLYSGAHTISVRAYSALPGAGSTSAPAVLRLSVL